MDAFRKLSSSSRASAREQELITTEVSVESSSSWKGKELDEARGTATGQGLAEWAPQPAQTLRAEAATLLSQCHCWSWLVVQPLSQRHSPAAESTKPPDDTGGKEPCICTLCLVSELGTKTYGLCAEGPTAFFPVSFQYRPHKSLHGDQ